MQEQCLVLNTMLNISTTVLRFSTTVLRFSSTLPEALGSSS